MLSINPKMPACLDDLEEDLTARRKRAIEEDWRGDVIREVVPDGAHRPHRAERRQGGGLVQVRHRASPYW
ncbi:hypothetical protein [Streptomyces decoyicus]|uniref:hypothetical protein n=1 Tax=Streptomyces decoyicus TaxID=249567 RepID=UPI000AC99183|nr:hypothetical protein [Streptomyces decoyicus]QZY21034.1 hypothetical protein K7C20_19835 [Streptomyces decoyicus]